MSIDNDFFQQDRTINNSSSCNKKFTKTLICPCLSHYRRHPNYSRQHKNSNNSQLRFPSPYKSINAKSIKSSTKSVLSEEFPIYSNHLYRTLRNIRSNNKNRRQKSIYKNSSIILQKKSKK